MSGSHRAGAWVQRPVCLFRQTLDPAGPSPLPGLDRALLLTGVLQKALQELRQHKAFWAHSALVRQLIHSGFSLALASGHMTWTAKRWGGK